VCSPTTHGVACHQVPAHQPPPTSHWPYMSLCRLLRIRRVHQPSVSSRQVTGGSTSPIAVFRKSHFLFVSGILRIPPGKLSPPGSCQGGAGKLTGGPVRPNSSIQKLSGVPPKLSCDNFPGGRRGRKKSCNLGHVPLIPPKANPPLRSQQRHRKLSSSLLRSGGLPVGSEAEGPSPRGQLLDLLRLLDPGRRPDWRGCLLVADNHRMVLTAGKKF